SFLGHSQTRKTVFQSRMGDSSISDPYVRFVYRWQGWQISAQDVRKQVDTLGRRYGLKLYADGFLGDTQTIKLYEINLSLHLYATGLSQLLSMSSQDEKKLERKYYQANRCDLYMNDLSGMTGDEETNCAALERFEGAFSD